MKVNCNNSGDLSQSSEYTSDENKAALIAYLDTRSGWVEFDDIKSNVEAFAAAEPGVIHQACFDCGYTQVTEV